MPEPKKKKASRKTTTRKSTASVRKKTPAKSATRKKAPAKKRSTAGKASTARPKRSAAKAATGSSRRRSTPPRQESHTGLDIEQQLGSFLDGITDLTSNALKFASTARERAEKAREQFTALGKEPVRTPAPEQLRRMADAGESLRDLREVAGMTLADITSALNLKDKSFMEAVEDGREALSLEMIMRLASLYARNDPIPFVVQYVRTYRPKLWEVLEDWGLDGLPIKIERERRFINIYKRRDAARQLSAEGFDKVLAFTQQAFDMSLHFVAELEDIENEINPDFDDEPQGD